MKKKGVFLFKKGRGELRGKIDTELKKFLGPLSEDKINLKKRENELDRSRIEEIDDELKNSETSGDKIENLFSERNELEEIIDEREKNIENIEEQI